MNLQEQADVIRTASIIRTARKLRGKTQLSVAQHLGVSQSYLSKLENGHLIPSSSQWFNFCNFTQVNPAKTFEMGMIDHCHPVENELPYLDSTFRIHPKFKKYPATQVRAVFPFIHLFLNKLGIKSFKSYCDSQDIDPDFFRVFDNRTNFAMILDIVQVLIQKAALKVDDLSELVLPVRTAPLHGCLRESYDRLSKPLELIQSLIHHSDKYATNFEYKIINLTHEKMTLDISPNAFLSEFDYKNEFLGNFICQYHQKYLESFASYGGYSQPIQIEEKQCHFQGHDRCIYELMLCPSKE